MKLAEAIVKAYLAKVLTLADQLTERGQIEAATFAVAPKQQVSARLTRLSEKKLALETQGNCMAACKNSF